VTALFPRSLPEFQRVFPDDAACQSYLEALRWPEGFVCPKCKHREEPYRFKTRSSVVLRCRACQKSASLTAGTVMQSSHTKLSTWFWGAYLMMTHTPGMSSVQFQRQLNIKRIETAFQILHKLRSATVRPERDMIGSEWPVEIDECLVGGATRGEGEGVHHKTVVVGAVEVRTREDGGRANARAHDRRRLYAGRLRLAVVRDRSGKSLVPFVTASVVKGARVKTDAHDGYRDLCEKHGYSHDIMVMANDPANVERHLPLIHRIFSNLKAWLDGTHHGRVEPQHLQAYLNEFVFRFNRRFYPMTAFNSVLGISARTVSATYAELYSGKWKHPS
jgi:ISXO2 transposase-like protein/transposase-like zinc ribbon protein